MKWVQINKAFFNTDLIQAFYWSNGKLYVDWLGEPERDYYDDPKQENYRRLCARLALRPEEGGKDGKN